MKIGIENGEKERARAFSFLLLFPPILHSRVRHLSESDQKQLDATHLRFAAISNLFLPTVERFGGKVDKSEEI